MFEAPYSRPATLPDWLSALSGRSSGFAPDRRYASASRAEPLSARENGAEAAASAAEAESALQEAFAAGLAQGRAEGDDKLVADRIAHERLRLAMQRLDERLVRQVADRLACTVSALCESALEPLSLDAAALERRCVTAARLLGEAQAQLELHLHPDDVASLEPDFAAGWSVVPRPDFERGTIRIEGPEAGVIDGPAEWRAALDAALKC